MSLLAPETYRQATAAQRAEICNGAGPEGGGWWVPDTIWGLRITEAADIHDWMYHHGRTADQKEWADTVFLRNMQHLVENDRSWWGRLLAPLRRRRALKYYAAVRYLGSGAYWRGKKK